jgi:hypothetical protein
MEQIQSFAIRMYQSMSLLMSNKPVTDIKNEVGLPALRIVNEEFSAYHKEIRDKAEITLKALQNESNPQQQTSQTPPYYDMFGRKKFNETRIEEPTQTIVPENKSKEQKKPVEETKSSVAPPDPTDTNHDGVVDLTERNAEFDRIDKNKDLVIQFSEWLRGFFV